jgi:hypothetical protein
VEYARWENLPFFMTNQACSNQIHILKDLPKIALILLYDHDARGTSRRDVDSRQQSAAALEGRKRSQSTQAASSSQSTAATPAPRVRACRWTQQQEFPNKNAEHDDSA